MTIELNGDRIELRAGASVAELVEHTGAGGDRRGVAVAVDGEVVPRSAWQETLVSDGQKVEVVGAIQGG
jgi:sulfur carrier protein